MMMIDCDAVMRQLWDYLDGELTGERERAMREHLAVCARCYPHYDFERAFLSALAATRRDVARGGGKALGERVRAALRAHGMVTAGSG
jgi:anti-sigma factor (TIGR02949 family)